MQGDIVEGDVPPIRRCAGNGGIHKLYMTQLQMKCIPSAECLDSQRTIRVFDEPDNCAFVVEPIASVQQYLHVQSHNEPSVGCRFGGHHLFAGNRIEHAADVTSVIGVHEKASAIIM
jgi:hypothetical protein